MYLNDDATRLFFLQLSYIRWYTNVSCHFFQILKYDAIWQNTFPFKYTCRILLCVMWTIRSHLQVGVFTWMVHGISSLKGVHKRTHSFSTHLFAQGSCQRDFNITCRHLLKKYKTIDGQKLKVWRVNTFRHADRIIVLSWIFFIAKSNF